MKNKSLSSIFTSCMQSCSQNNPLVGVAILRIGVGLVFLLAGVSKLVSLKMTVFMFTQVGLAPFWVYIVAVVETLGGLMLVVGFWTRFAAIPLGISMLVASVIQFRFGGGVMGAISPLVLFLTQVQFYFSGSGAWALDNKLRCMCGICGNCTSAKPEDNGNPVAVSKNSQECVCSGGGPDDCNCDDTCVDCSCASQK